MSNVSKRLYPEIAAGGFPHNQPLIIFFTRVNILVDENFTVLDFGAGRGAHREDVPERLHRHTDITRRVKKLVAFDVDPTVLNNIETRHRFHAEVGAPLPVEDEIFDAIISLYALEHVEDAVFYASEIARVMKPGAWFCAVTPNKWGYHGIGARLIPNSWHARLLKFFTPHRGEGDSFPTVHRMNTIADLKRLFPEDRFLHASFTLKQPPRYHGNRMWLARLWILYDWLMPRALHPGLRVFVQKQERSGRRAREADSQWRAQPLSRAPPGAAPAGRTAAAQAGSLRDRAARRPSPSGTSGARRFRSRNGPPNPR